MEHPRDHLEEASLKQVFDEFRGGKQTFNFTDFEKTIRRFNLQLMPGLSQDEPDFTSLCLEMYSLISISPFKTEPLRYEKSMLKEKTTREKK